MVTRALLCALALTGVLSACQKDETVTAYGASGKLWTLESIDGAAFSARATLEFPEEGGIKGSAPCNGYSATQSAPYPWFEPGPIAATKRACPDLEAESAYFAALAQMTLVEVQGDTLILSNDAKQQMVFRAGT